MMTVSVGVTPCPPQPKDLEQQLDKKDSQDDEINKEVVSLNSGLVRCDDAAQRTVQSTTSFLKTVENDEKVLSEVTGSSEASAPSSDSAVNVENNQGDVLDVNNKCVSPIKATKAGRAVSRGRRKSENKDYNQKSQGGGRNRGRKISKSARDYENSSSNGGNSGADGNGEDNGSDDDDEDDDADEDDDDDDDDDDDEGEDDDDDDDEESKNEDDDDDISLNGNDKNVKSEPKIKQEPDDQEMYPTGLQSFMAGLDGSNIPLADLLEKLPNSVCPGDESGSSPAAPGVPVTLHGIVCHEIGGVLVVNIKWRNKFYCGSLIDCSRHAWASPRFPAADGGENEMKMGGKGGKGKRRQKNNSVSSSVGMNMKEATPLKHKLRGRKRGVSGCPPPKSQGFKGMGKRRSKNMDDDDDGPRPGKRSCTMKTTVSPQPSPTLIECPEPGCDKKYKHINGLRYHQAHAHLEESNHSDERSASTSPSPVEEFKEPDTKPGFKGRTSRVSARARSISPSLAAAIASMNEKKSDSLSRGGKKKETSEPSLDSATIKEEPKMSKSPIPASEEDSNMDDMGTTVVEISDKCQQACEHDIRKENSQNNIEQAKRETESKSGCKHTEELETAVKSLENEKVLSSEDIVSPATQMTSGSATSTAVLTGKSPDAGKVRTKESVQNSQEVWETVIDSGFSVANGNTKSHSLVEDVEKALGENSKHSDSKLCIPGVQPVDLRQAVDTGVGLINQLGIEVEDISENEEDIDPGQDSEYTSKDIGALPSSSATTDRENSFGESKPRGITFAGKDRCLTQIQKPEVSANKSLSSSDTLRTKLGDSFYFDIKNENNSTDEKRNQKPESKTLSEFQNRKTELWTKSDSPSSQSSLSLQRNIETKPTSLEDKVAKSTSESISMEDLVSKSISRSAVEPPLINSDAPSMRYKFFECRNYGDDNYDKCIRTSDVDYKGIAESKGTLAPIRYPELVRNGANSEAIPNCKELPAGSEAVRSGVHVKKVSSNDENCSNGKIVSRDLAVPAGSTRTRSPIPEAFKRNLNLPDKVRASMDSKSPSSVSSLTGSMTKHLSSRPGFDSSSQSLSSPSSAGSKAHTSTVDRKNPSNPFQPIIVKHEFQPAESMKGIKQEVSSASFNQSDSKTPFVSSVSITTGEPGKPSVEFKGNLGLNESTGHRSSPSIQEAEDYEKSYKAAARALSRPHPTLISRNSSSLPPSLPVGVAHPYPRASDSASASSHMKGSELKSSATMSSVTSVTYSSTSPIPLSSTHNVSADLSQPENKAKQLQTLQLPIPVGEVSPVSLKRSPGPAIHSGLPSVLPIIGPGIKTQGSAASHPVVRPGIKAGGMGEQVRSERKSESSLRAPSPYGRSKSPVPRSLAAPKPSPECKSPQPMALYHKARPSGESVREDSDVTIVKEDHLTYGAGKDKPGVVETEGERRDVRAAATAELNFRSQEPMSAEQLRNLQLQQQMTLQYYQPFMQGGMSLEMVKNLHVSQLAYLQGMPVDPKLLQKMQPEQQMQLMQLQRQMMLEQEKQGMRGSGSSSHPEARNFEKKEIPKPGDRVQDERRMEESGAKKSPQGRPLHADVSESEFRRFPGQGENLRYAVRSLSPKVMHKLSPEEPAEKKSRADDSYERERELERQKYKREEEFLQKQKLKQQISMYKQLENDLQKEQLGANFPRKRQITPEKSERVGSSSREEERIENGARNTREMIHHRPQESATSTGKVAHHSFEAENSSGQGSPRGQVLKSQSCTLSRSPRPSRSPVPASRYKDSLPASEEKRDGSNSLPANFMPTQFQAYLSQLNFDPSAVPLPYGAHQMLVGSQLSLPPGVGMTMPITSHGESSLVTAVASNSREREARSPYRSSERDQSLMPTSHSNSQSRTSTSESHERLQRLKDAEKEPRHSPVMFQEERSRNRSIASEQQNVSSKSNSTRASDLKTEDSSSHARPSIISNNLAISRMAGHMDVLTEEEIIRRQRFAAEYGDPREAALHMNYYVPPGLIRMDPAYAANMMQSSSQHMGRGMEHYMTKRQ